MYEYLFDFDDSITEYVGGHCSSQEVRDYLKTAIKFSNMSLMSYLFWQLAVRKEVDALIEALSLIIEGECFKCNSKFCEEIRGIFEAYCHTLGLELVWDNFAHGASTEEELLRGTRFEKGGFLSMPREEDERDRRLDRFLESFRGTEFVSIVLGFKFIEEDARRPSWKRIPKTRAGLCSVEVRNGRIRDEDVSRIMALLDDAEVTCNLPSFSVADDWGKYYVLDESSDGYSWVPYEVDTEGKLYLGLLFAC